MYFLYPHINLFLKVTQRSGSGTNEPDPHPVRPHHHARPHALARHLQDLHTTHTRSALARNLRAPPSLLGGAVSPGCGRPRCGAASVLPPARTRSPLPSPPLSMPLSMVPVASKMPRRLHCRPMAAAGEAPASPTQRPLSAAPTEWEQPREGRIVSRRARAERAVSASGRRSRSAAGVSSLPISFSMLRRTSEERASGCARKGESAEARRWHGEEARQEGERSGKFKGGRIRHVRRPNLME